MKFKAIKAGGRSLWLFCLLCASVANCFSLDREAFSFTHYELTLQVEPEQHRLGVRGFVTLRNDTQSPQKIAVLQISSSLSWKSIKAGQTILQIVTQPFTSDIDHTGALSEAIVTLPQSVAPKATIDLTIAYEGVVLPDATRFTRTGVPDDTALSADWDQIGEDFTALRGAGYVAWYPIATDVANLSEGDSLFEVRGRWKTREAGSKMRLHLGLTRPSNLTPLFLLGGALCPLGDIEAAGITQHTQADCACQVLRLDTPSLVIADYQALEKPWVEVYYLRGHDAAAANFAESAGEVSSFINQWFGAAHERAQIADLPETKAAPFESGVLLLTPLIDSDPRRAGLVAAHQLTHASFVSFRPWIEEGLAHFAQVLYLEHESGRQAALDYLGSHSAAFIAEEKAPATARSEDKATQSLVNTINEQLYRSKAMFLWWMLRDMVGEPGLKKAIAAYRPEQDKEPSYMQKLIQAQTQRDLQWFFDDWVNHDRGLPDFKVESAFASKTPSNSYMVTVTVGNLGSAGAEVPVKIKFSGGETTKRLEVRAKSKATIRIEVPAAAQDVAVNDGSVPESDTTNNTFKIAQDAK
jgi:hypothetical protein